MGFTHVTYRLPLVFNALAKDDSVLITPPHGFAFISHSKCEAFGADATIHVVTQEFLGIHFNLGTKIRYKIGEFSGNMAAGDFNFAFIPAGLECVCIVKKGSFSSLSIHYPQQYMELLEPYFPVLLKDLFTHAAGKTPFALCAKHLRFDEVLKRKVDAIMNVKIKAGVCRETMLNSIAFDILLYSLECVRDSLTKEPSLLRPDFKRRVEHAHRHLTQNFNHGFSLELLADLVGLDKRKLQRGFKILYKTTLVKFIIDFRLNKAKEYLKDRNIPIEKIAILVGFKRHRYLNKVFKDKFGKTPGEERNEQISNADKEKEI